MVGRCEPHQGRPAPRKSTKRPQTASDDEAVEEWGQDRNRNDVVSVARMGLPGSAVQHSSSMGLAPDTAATEAMMRSKFVAPPPSQSTLRRVTAPAPNEVIEIALLVAIRSFGDQLAGQASTNNWWERRQAGGAAALGSSPICSQPGRLWQDCVHARRSARKLKTFRAMPAQRGCHLLPPVATPARCQNPGRGGGDVSLEGDNVVMSESYYSPSKRP